MGLASCPRCQNAIMPGHMFCERCGASLPQESSPPLDQGPPPPPPPPPPLQPQVHGSQFVPYPSESVFFNHHVEFKLKREEVFFRYILTDKRILCLDRMGRILNARTIDELTDLQFQFGEIYASSKTKLIDFVVVTQAGHKCFSLVWVPKWQDLSTAFAYVKNSLAQRSAGTPHPAMPPGNPLAQGYPPPPPPPSDSAGVSTQGRGFDPMMV